MTPPTDHSTVTLWLLAVFAGVVVFLFKLLYNQITKATRECQNDRDVLRKKIDEQTNKINSLETRTAIAETLAGVPCSHDECPRVKLLTEKLKQE